MHALARRFIPLAVLMLVAAYVGFVQLGAHAADTLLSQGKPATASSAEGEEWAAGRAVDGNTGTRWSSQFSDPQWLRVDLGATAIVTQVVLRWETAYGKDFQIQTSPDGSAWTTIHTVTNGTGGTQTLTVNGSGRYVRMNGTARGTGYGYSLWEFEVYGTTGGTTPPTTPPPTTPPPTQEPGWTNVWQENFDGPANTSPSAANWLLRTGTQYPGGAANWGTGSVETASNSTANVSLDGSGCPAIP